MLMRAYQSRPGPIVATALLLALGVARLPWEWARSARSSLRSPETGRVDRGDSGGGYYEALINGGGPDGPHGETALRLLGKPSHWVSFHDVGATRDLDGDPLLFELRPDFNRLVFGEPFTTNHLGLRDRPYSSTKPDGTFRIVLLGSSIDMGWGVGTGQTYENLLEDWLNARAARIGLGRRFEVLNFAVAAYGPAQRVESFRRKAAGFEPDLVLYSATTLDARLASLHLCRLLQKRIDLNDGALRRAVRDAGLTAADLRLDDDGELVAKHPLRAKLRPYLWGIADDELGSLAAECRSRRLPLAVVLVPRAGRSDAPDARALAVARQRAIAARHALPLLDLSAAFDGHDLESLALAAWDDHPNVAGHACLFRALARSVVEDRGLSTLLFVDRGPMAHDP